MGRRRQSNDAALAEAITGLLVLFALGWIFSPQFRALIILLVCAAFLGLAVWVCYRIIKRKSSLPLSDDSSQTFFLDKSKRIKIEGAMSTAEPIQELTISQKLQKIDWFQFEKLIELIYRHRGYSVQRMGGANPDGGVDLIIESATEKLIVQCKHWRKWSVGVRHIREFLGAMADSKISSGIFITLNGYSGEAKQLADKHGIQILNESNVVKMLEDSGLIYSQEISELFSDSRKFCPKCESEMVLRTARLRGNQFWGCSNYPRCKFILNLE
ncbi:MAG TPA: restriction endonuclease [Verrucomicrobiae bacterium]